MSEGQSLEQQASDRWVSEGRVLERQGLEEPASDWKCDVESVELFRGSLT